MIEIVESKTAIGCVAQSPTCPYEKMPSGAQKAISQFVKEAVFRTLLLLRG